MKFSKISKLKMAKSVQKGFTLVELLFVIGAIGILAALGTPVVRSLLIEGRTEPTAKDIITISNVLRASAAASGITNPYTQLGAAANATATFANAARGKALALSVAGAGATATVQHALGAEGAQVAVASAGGGANFTVTLPTVNKAACPGLATQLNRVSESISINGTVVKAVNGVYNGSTAENACTADDTLTYVFTFR